MVPKFPRYYVYLLSRPDGSVFYIGKGSRYRINQHEGEARSSCSCKKCNTIRKIWRQGGEVQKLVVFITPDEREAYECETEFIRYYGRGNLTNQTDGGPGQYEPSGKTRARIAEANRKRVFTPEMRQERRERQLGRKHSPQTIERLREINKGKTLSEEARRKIGEANRRRKQTPESIKKISEANRGRKLRPETIEKMRAARKRQKTTLSEEARKRIGEASRARISKPEMRTKLIAAITGKPHSEERRAKEKEAAQRRAKSEAWKRNHQQAMAAYRQQKNEATAALIGGLLKQGLSVKEIMEQTGFGKTTVRRWKAKLKEASA